MMLTFLFPWFRDGVLTMSKRPVTAFGDRWLDRDVRWHAQLDVGFGAWKSSGLLCIELGE